MKEAKKLIRDLWKEFGSKVPLRKIAGMENVNATTAIRNKKLLNNKLKNNIVLYDQITLWFILVASVLSYDGNSNEIRSRATYAALTSAVVSLLISIRQQITVGHDLSAKILLRSLCEYVDVLSLLIVQPELVAEFENEDFKCANQFWHKHVKSNKATKRLMQSALKGSEKEKWHQEWVDWQRQEDTVLSLAAHPSFVAASMTRIPVNESTDQDAPLEWPIFLGYVTDFSIRTMQYAIMTVGMPVILADFPFGRAEKLSGVVAYDERESLHVDIEKSRQVLFGIVRFLCEEGGSDDHFNARLIPQ